MIKLPQLPRMSPQTRSCSQGPVSRCSEAYYLCCRLTALVRQLEGRSCGRRCGEEVCKGQWSGVSFWASDCKRKKLIRVKSWFVLSMLNVSFNSTFCRDAKTLTARGLAAAIRFTAFGGGYFRDAVVNCHRGREFC